MVSLQLICPATLLARYKYITHLVEESHLWTLSGDLPELGVDILVLEVLIDERADLGELVQSSSAAGL